MRKFFTVCVFMQAILFAAAQKRDSIPDLSKGHAISNLQADTIKERDRASQTLRSLRNGSVIVRLKTNQKSVDAYRRNGQSNIADRIIEDRKKQNLKMYSAFKNNFHFCKVYFIYANETDEFRKREKVFLNENLEHDAQISLSDTNFIFCEYGSVESFSKFHDYEHPLPNSGYLSSSAKGKKILDTIPSQTSTSPATTNGLFFSDKNLQQLHRPFPFVAGVYLENFDAPVRTLNRELERAFNRLIVGGDFKIEMKEHKKKEKQKRKESPR